MSNDSGRSEKGVGWGKKDRDQPKVLHTLQPWGPGGGRAGNPCNFALDRFFASSL